MCAEYEAMLDGTTPSPTFNQALDEAHSYLQSAYNALIAKNKINALHVGAGSIAANAGCSTAKGSYGPPCLMKEALRLAFSTDHMSDQRVCADMFTNTAPYSMARCKPEEECLRSHSYFGQVNLDFSEACPEIHFRRHQAIVL